MNRTISSAALLALLATSGEAATHTTPLIGINFAGAEFGSEVPGTKGKDYHYPNNAEYRRARTNGFNIIRLPFRWERVQPQLGGNLDENNVLEIVNAIRQSELQSMHIILDMHNSARYNGININADPAIQKAYFEFWGIMAKAFRTSENVMFGLMNEPINVDADHATAACCFSCSGTGCACRKPATSIWIK